MFMNTNYMETTPPKQLKFNNTGAEHVDTKEINFQAEKNSRWFNIKPAKSDHHIDTRKKQSTRTYKHKRTCLWQEIPNRDSPKFGSHENKSHSTINPEDEYLTKEEQKRQKNVDLTAPKADRSSNINSLYLNHEDEMFFGNFVQSRGRSRPLKFSVDFLKFYSKMKKHRLDFPNQTFFAGKMDNLYILLRWCYHSRPEEFLGRVKWIPTKDLVGHLNVEKVKILTEFVYQKITNAEKHTLRTHSILKSVNSANKNQDIIKQKTTTASKHAKLPWIDMNETESHDVKCTGDKKIECSRYCYFFLPFFYNNVRLEIQEKSSFKHNIFRELTRPCGTLIIINCDNLDLGNPKHLQASISFKNFRVDLSMLKNFIIDILVYNFTLIENEKTEKYKPSTEMRGLDEVPNLFNATKNTHSLDKIAAHTPDQMSSHEKETEDFNFSPQTPECLNTESIEIITKDVVLYAIKKLYELKEMFPDPLEENEELSRKIFKELISLACCFPIFRFAGKKKHRTRIFLSAYKYLLDHFSIFNPGPLGPYTTA